MTQKQKIAAVLGKLLFCEDCSYNADTDEVCRPGSNGTVCIPFDVFVDLVFEKTFGPPSQVGSSTNLVGIGCGD